MRLAKERLLLSNNALDTLLADCPIVGVWAETGTGKTTFCGSLMEDTRYRKCLYLDADRGATTIEHLTSQPDLCDYRYPENVVNAHGLQQWLIKQLVRASSVEGIGSIIVEGVARIYEDAVGEQFATASEDQLSGYKLMQLYNVPAQQTKAVLVMIGNLQAKLRKAGRAVPIIFTCNTKERRDDSEGAVWQVPAISDTSVKLIMARANGFVQLQRRGSTVTIATDRDSRTTARKVRHAGAAKAIAKLRNPTLPQMLQTWADAKATQTQSVTQFLSKENNEG